LLLARLKALSQRAHVEALLLGLGEDALAGFLFLADMMLDVFGQDGDLGIVKLRAWLPAQQVLN
jgi:hypothetical protein